MASTTCNGKPPTNLLAAAAAYLQLGWLPIPVGFRTKIPPLDDWETLRPTTDRLTQLFPPGQEQNVGLLLGTPSGGLVDVDLDVEEAVVASRFLLPKTPLRHGRPGNPHSHFWYRLADPPAKAQTAFKDADGTMLLEVRSTGRQTVVPPSVHEDGGQLTWESWGQPTVLAADQLLAAAGTVAAAALLARHWPGEGGRQDAALALAGGLLRAGWAVETSERFLEAVATAAGDEEVRMRIDTVARTKEKIDTDEPATGWPALGQLVSEPVVRQVRLWLRAPESTAPWPVPIPLREVPDVLPFPVGVLPAPIQRLVEEIAWAMNCPLDFPGVAVLALAGGALANSRHLAITRTHLQSPCLYACWVARPGSLKSAPLKFLRRPFDRRQQLYLDDFQREIEAWEEADEDDRGPKPVLRRCIVSDITTESLGIILCENPRGVLMVRNEAAALLAGMNQYKGGKGHDRQVYLNLWDGDTIIIDRKSDKSRHGAPLYVGDPFTAIVGTLQPDVLPALRGESAHGQTTPDDGFRDRFLIVYPPERPAVREQWRDIGMAAQTLWQDVVERLLGLAMVTDDARPRPFFVNLTPCGRLAWEAFTARHAEEVNHPDFPNHLFGPWSKLRGYGARLALILHYLRWATGEAQSEEVDGESMHRAEGLVDYFKSHARKVAAAMDADPQVLEARKLFQWIVAQRLERFQKRQAHAALRGSFPTVEDLETALRVLERYGVVRPGASRDRPGPGRKPSPFYEVNPAALALTVSSQSPSACVPKRDAAGDSVYSVNSVQELAVCPQVGDGSSFSAEPGPSDPGRPAPLASARGPQNTQNPQNRSASGVAPFWNESARDAQNTQNPQNRSPAWDRPGATPDSVDSVDSVNEERSFAVVRNDRELPSVLQALEESELVALDLETTGLNPRQDRARLLSLAMPERGNYVIDLFHVDPRPAFEMLAEKIVIGHNLIFDLGFLARLGFTPGAVRDTLLLSQILSAGQRQSHTLADVVERHLGQKMDKTEQKGDWSGTLTDAQLRYAAADVDVLLPLHQTLEQEIRTADLTRVADLEHRCLPALVWLAGAGVGFDQDGWLALATAAAEEAEELLGRLHQTAPPPPQTSLFGNSRNWDSTNQVKDAFAQVGVVLDKTNDDALAAVDHPLAALLRHYRAARKRVSTYGRDWFTRHATDGRVYAGWVQIGADSGRMACRSPNLQNLPRGKEYRRCFTAPAGRVLVKADYSQIELRIAARIADEPTMLDAYRQGLDLHTLTARRILGKEEVTKADRQLSKSLNFGLLYGMGAKGFRVYARSSYGVELTAAQAKEYRNAFFRAYPCLRKWHTKASGDAAIDTRTLAGRCRRSVRRFTEKLNTPVQGTGADGLKAALGLLWERRDQTPGTFPVLVVHDEIVVECDEAQAEVVSGWLKQAMIDGMAPLIDPVPVEVEVNVAPTWGG